MSVITNKPPKWLVNGHTTQVSQPMMTSGTTFTINGVAVTSPSFTKEESERLAELERDFKERLKQLKIDKFRSTVSYMRQFIITCIKAQFCVDWIAETETTKSLEHVALEDRARLSGHIPMPSGGIPKWSEENDLLKILNHLSLEELERAHLEQSMEEEVLNGK